MNSRKCETPINPKTQERLDRIVRIVFATGGGYCCRRCGVKFVFDQARLERLRVSLRDVTSRVNALWGQRLDDAPSIVQ